MNELSPISRYCEMLNGYQEIETFNTKSFQHILLFLFSSLLPLNSSVKGEQKQCLVQIKDILRTGVESSYLEDNISLKTYCHVSMRILSLKDIKRCWVPNWGDVCQGPALIEFEHYKVWNGDQKLLERRKRAMKEKEQRNRIELAEKFREY